MLFVQPKQRRQEAGAFDLDFERHACHLERHDRAGLCVVDVMAMIETIALAISRTEIELAAARRPSKRAGIHRTGLADLDHLPASRQIVRSEEHTSELQSLMRISYAVFCLKKKNNKKNNMNNTYRTHLTKEYRIIKSK